MKKISLVLFLIVWTGFIFAQTAGKVSGTVKDQNGRPLAGANVIVLGTSFGGATDSDGNYYILQVPAGVYDIRADYIGYKSETVSGIRVATELTSFVDYSLAIAAVEGESVEVIGERPLLEMSATNAVRSMDTDQIKNFASRNVNDMIQAQAGVSELNSEIHLRGSRDDEVGFSVDGVSTKAVQSFGNQDGSNYNIINVIPEALQEVSVQSGGYSAELGGANAGIIQQTMRTGGRTLSGSIGYETDALAETFNTNKLGANDFTFTLGGPITEKIRFFGAYRLDDTDNYRHQWWEGAVINADENGDPIPILDTNSPSANPVSYAVVIPDEIEGRTQTEHSLNGTLLFDYNPLILRVSGAYTNRTSRNNGDPIFNMWNMERQRENNWNIMLGSLKGTYFLNSKTYVHLTVSALDRKWEGYDPNFNHDNLADILEYGDGDIVAEKGLTTFVNPASGDTIDGTWTSRWNQGSPILLSQFQFAKPGRMPAGWGKSEQSNFGTKGGFASQIGTHEVKIGFDYLKWTTRNYAVGTGLIASINQQIDTTPALQTEFDNETATAATLLRRSRVQNVGYDEFGNIITDKDHIDYAKNPTSMSFYVNDKIEKDDLVVNAGIRVDRYTMDDWVMVDPENPGYDQANASFLEDQLTDSETYTVIQPRLGLGFPISDQAVFHLQYGKFVQMPDMAQSFKSRSQLALYLGGQNFIPDPSGFDLEPIVTEQFEVGFGYQLGNVAALDMTVFSKNTTGQLEIKWASVDPNNEFGASDYAYYANGDFTNVSGVELTARTRRINIFQLDGSFTFTDARGTNSFPGSGAGQVEINKDNLHAPSMISPLRYENKFKGTGTIDMRWADGEGGFLENSGLNLHMSFNSGHSFTRFSGGMGQRNASRGALLEDGDPRARVPIEPIGASTTPWVFNFNLKAEKGFNVGGIRLTAYALVQNLFNAQHVINVYNRTGNAYDDGFLTDPELSAKIVENLGQSFVDLYEAVNLANRTHWINDHGFDLFGTPREINFGITASF